MKKSKEGKEMVSKKKDGIAQKFGASSPDSTRIRDILQNWDGRKEEIKDFYENIKKEIKISTYHCNPGDISTYLIKTGENAYHRAFLKKKYAKLELKNVPTITLHWLDIEVPVVLSESSRKPCLDMIGKINGSSFVIAELKVKRGTSPFDAIRELLFYAIHAKENNKNGKKLESHKNIISKNGTKSPILSYWENYSDAKYLIVAAPNDYWDIWLDHKDKLEEIAGWIKSKWQYELRFVRFELEEFEKQTSKGKAYEPEYHKDVVWKEI